LGVERGFSNVRPTFIINSVNTENTRPLPASDSLNAFAQALLDLPESERPRLVFVPSQQAANALKSSWKGRFHGVRIVPFRQWLAEISPPQAGFADVVGLAQLLQARGWFKGDVDSTAQSSTARSAFAMAQHMQSLVAQLAETHAAPMDEASFKRLVQAKARDGQQSAADRETALVWELWRAQESHGKGSFGLSLANAVAQLRGSDQPSDKPILAHTAWLAPPEGLVGLEARVAQALEGNCAGVWLPELPADPLATARVWSAASLEQEATAVAHVVSQARAGWEGAAAPVGQSAQIEMPKRIGIIALDRLAARRVRALLERQGVALDDRAGWALSTTRAAAAVMRWLECVEGDFAYRPWLDWLRSPFVLPANDHGHAIRREAETAMVARNVTQGLARLQGALAVDSPSRAWLTQVQAAAHSFAKPRQTVAQWFAALESAFTALGMREALQADAAGQQVLEALQRAGADTAQLSAPVSFALWRNAVAAVFESASFVAMPYEDADGKGVSSDTLGSSARSTHVTLLALSQAAYTSFDLLIVLGAGARNLPGNAEPPGVFGHAMRAALGLGDAVAHARAVERQLASALAHAAQSVITWRSAENRDAAGDTLSPILLRWDLARRCAGHASVLGRAPLHEAVNGVADSAVSAHAPANTSAVALAAPSPSAAQRIPPVVSVSQYRTLIQCPYRFFVQAVLKLRAPENVTEAATKADYGTWAHAVLHYVHSRHAQFQNVRDETLKASFDKAIARAMPDAPVGDGWREAWALRIRAWVPAYIAWQREREKQGWQVTDTEAARARRVLLPDGSVTVLQGRLDRADEGHGVGEGAEEGAKEGAEEEEGDRHALALADYKTSDLKTLRAAAKAPSEEVQLSAYRLLAEANGNRVAETAYVALGDSVVSVPVETDAMAEEARFMGVFSQLRGAAPMPANGVPSVCGQCEARGLCRKQAWADASQIEGESAEGNAA
jgi:ATP-dependent helicase/nuclease subunit B